MRVVYPFLLLCLIFACRPQKPIVVTKPQPTSLASLREKYKIVRIDSIQHVYVIYARKDGSIYKMVSRKDSLPCAYPIKVGGEYPLAPLSIGGRIIPGKIDHSTEWLHIHAVDFAGVGIRFERDSTIDDIFVAFNLRGLCVEF